MFYTTSPTRLRVFIRDRFACVFCGRSVLTGKLMLTDLNIDHFWPESLGGTNRIGNLVCSCTACNSLKANRVYKTIEEARKDLDRLRQEHSRKFITRAMKYQDVDNGLNDLMRLRKVVAS